jgi:hypothetical protein
MCTHSNKIILIHVNGGVRQKCRVRRAVCSVRHFNSCSVRGVRSSVRQCGSVRQCAAVCGIVRLPGSVRQCVAVCGSVWLPGSVRQCVTLCACPAVCDSAAVCGCLAVQQRCAAMRQCAYLQINSKDVRINSYKFGII